MSAMQSGKTAFMHLDEKDFGVFEYVRPTVAGLGGRVKSMYSDFVVKEVNQEGKLLDASCWPAVEEDSDEEDDSDIYQYVRFIVHKALLETSNAIQCLSEAFEIPRNAFSYCGLKDCCAITTQEMCVHRDWSTQIQQVLCSEAATKMKLVHRDSVQLFRLTDNIAVSRPYPSIHSRKLKRGHCNGNHFTIILRGTSADVEQVRTSSAALGSLGFVNYYGLQRFGKTATRNVEVGKAYLLARTDISMYSKAVDAILGPQPWGCTSQSERQARAAWVRTQDPKVVLKLMPFQYKTERELLEQLIRHSAREEKKHRSRSEGNSPHWVTEQRADSPLKQKPRGGSGFKNFKERDAQWKRLAFLSLPLQVRLLAASAYFNKVWNVMVSERLRLYGMRVVAGDLVYKPVPHSDESPTSVAEQCKGSGAGGGGLSEETAGVAATNAAESEFKSLCVCREEQTPVRAARPDTRQQRKRSSGGHTVHTVHTVRNDSSRLHVVTAVEAESKHYCIHDVVMPLPGYSVLYPTHSVGQLYRQYLAYDGLTADVLVDCSIERCYTRGDGEEEPWVEREKLAGESEAEGEALRSRAKRQKQEGGGGGSGSGGDSGGGGGGRGRTSRGNFVSVVGEESADREAEEGGEEQEEDEAAAEHGFSFWTGTERDRDISIMHFPGTYRKILARPQELAWEALAYTRPAQPLHLDPNGLAPAMNESTSLKVRDFKIISGQSGSIGADGASLGQGKKSKKSKKQKNNDKKQKNCKDESTADDSKYRAYKFTFVLPSGSYATMLMRELSKDALLKKQEQYGQKRDQTMKAIAVSSRKMYFVHDDDDSSSEEEEDSRLEKAPPARTETSTKTKQPNNPAKRQKLGKTKKSRNKNTKKKGPRV